MRVATYNLWNSTRDWSDRLERIMEDLATLDADVVALQEVPTRSAPKRAAEELLREQTSYRHVAYRAYPESVDPGERPEGLAMLSKAPFGLITTNWDAGSPTANNWALRVVVDWAGVAVGITNVHLDWESGSGRADGLQSMMAGLIESRPSDLEILLGDFNEDADAGLGNLLARASWRDLHVVFGDDPEPTVGFVGSPREGERGSSTGRLDRIYLLAGPTESRQMLSNAGVFGRGRGGAVAPSDHLGVFVDLNPADL